jgi:hypothetical protein
MFVKIPFWSIVVNEFSKTTLLSSELLSTRLSAIIKNFSPFLFS